jgi:hypothetical protein
MSRLLRIAPLLLLAMTGCEIRSFALGPDSGLVRPDGSAVDVLVPSDAFANSEGGTSDGGGPDGTPCIPTNGGLEICDGLDNDCNGAVDDVDPARLAVDPNNCGQCGNVCADLVRHVIGQCVNATCTQWACSSGSYKDPDGDLAQFPGGNGCECTITNGGQEICDGVDNDCNGVVDDGFDKTESPNCGECDNACSFPNAGALCSVCDCTDAACKGCGGGATQGRKCALGACLPNPDPSVNASFIDLNGGQADGCEYYCLLPPGQSGPVTETCDGYDNDCDGCVDGIRTGFDSQGKPVCAPHPALTTGYCEMVSGTCNLGTGVCIGECRAGVDTCQEGVTGCFGYVGPSYEVCNAKDDDCDGAIDNGYDRLNDARYCLSAGLDPVTGLCRPCQLLHAIPKCDAGVCKILSCQPGWVNADGIDDTGCEYPCTVTNGGIEICDGLDNNCNGQVDEGFNVQSDVHHCGTCGNDCTNLVQHPESAHAVMRCNAGVCQFDHCLNDGTTGYWNADGIAANGCEYYCSKTNGGVEICDGKDNNCDSHIDEGFNKQTDPNNCGSCGNACAYPNAEGVCNAGHCQMGACATGVEAGHTFIYVDLDGLPATGCEYRCDLPVGQTTPGAEICDGYDNDCNGIKDDAWAAQKDTPCVAGKGICAASTAGTYICNPNDRSRLCCGNAGTCLDPMTGHQDETGTRACNGLDDDCDGCVDGILAPDGVTCNPPGATQTDPTNCGACGNRCDVMYPSFHATWSCVAGACHGTGCLNNGTTGYWDTNGDVTQAPGAGNGCEYFCTKTNGGVEICDGKDNDCNGKTDLDDTLTSTFWPTAGNFCIQTGECGKGDHTMTGAPNSPDNTASHTHFGTTGSHPVCRTLNGVTTWYCNYPSSVDFTTYPTAISHYELRCDGLDNNCNGTTDDRWHALLGHACSEDGTYGTSTKYGRCSGTGALACKDGTPRLPDELPGVWLVCGIITSGGDPQPETCNNQDDDCDGLTDELWDSTCVGSNCSACPGGVCAGVRDNLYRVQRSNTSRYPGGLDFYIYKLEAARPDADTTTAGTATARACAKGTPATPATLAYPWASLNIGAARAACQAAGMRLCTNAEWTAACEGQCDTWRTDGCWMIARATQTGGSMAAGNPSFTFTGSGFLASDVGKMLSIGATPATGTFYQIIRYVSATQVVCAGNVSAQSGLSYTVMGQKLYPYSVDLTLDYQASLCNGNDYVVSPSPSGTGDDPVTSGFMNQCTVDTVYDMSGNLKEWTDDYRGTLSDTRKIYTLRGGSYVDPAQGLTCTFRDAVAAEDFAFPSTGFRCCKPALPSGVAPTDGYALCPMTTPASCTSCPDAAQCAAAECTSVAAGSFCDTPTDSTGARHCARYVNWANDNNNCGACGVVCSGGKTCQNGVCKLP